MNTVLAANSAMLWIFVLLNLALTIALARRLNEGLKVNQNGPAQLPSGQKPPTFSAKTLTDDRLTLDSFSGRPASFVFVSPGCHGCQDIPQILASLTPEAQQSGLDLILVSVADETETRLFLEGSEFDLPVLIAPRQENSWYADWRVPGTPFYVFIDAKGRVQNSNFFGKEYFRQEWRILEAKGHFSKVHGHSTETSQGGAKQREDDLKPVFEKSF